MNINAHITINAVLAEGFAKTRSQDEAEAEIKMLLQRALGGIMATYTVQIDLEG